MEKLETETNAKRGKNGAIDAKSHAGSLKREKLVKSPFGSKRLEAASTSRRTQRGRLAAL
jgi:hypothetical protein